MGLWRSFGCVLAVTTAFTATTHSAAGSSQSFDTALELGDLMTAAEEADKLASDQRRKGGTDPEIDAYYGRFLATQGLGIMAEPYLVRAIAGTSDRVVRDKLSFELARSREVDGLVGKAEADYRQLTSASTEPAVRSKATRALARLRLGAAPQEAIDMLTPLIGNTIDAPTRWEANLLLSRAFAIAGRAAESKAALDRAWLEAPLAEIPGNAISLTAMDMAVDRAFSGDRKGEVGLMSLESERTNFAGVAQLPVCGGAVRADDAVTIAIQADPRQRPIYSVVRASRPGIAQHFTVPIALAQQKIAGEAAYVTLRCRTALDPNVRFAGASGPNMPLWMAQKGYYPRLKPLSPDRGELVSQLKGMVQELEVEVGPQSPVLAPALLQLAFFQAAQSRYTNQQQATEARTLADRAIDILAKAGAPEDIVGPIRMQVTVAFAQNQNIADVAGPASLDVLNALLARPDTTPAQAYGALTGLSGWQLRPAQRIVLLDRVLAFFDTRKLAMNDPMRQSMELRRASVLREIGTVTGLKERLAARGIGSDLCSSADQTPSIPPSAITLTSDDYPKDLLRRNIAGMSTIELSMDAAGKIQSERMIVSQPTGLFDDITAQKLKAVTLIPARRSDQPIACRGFAQTVRWQMPYQGDFASPWESMLEPD